MELRDKTVAIFVEDLYDILEFWYPYYRLKEAGAKVVSIGSGRKAVFTGKVAIDVTADIHIDAALPSEFDGLVIPGGYSPDLMRRNRKMVDFVREMDKINKVIGAICHAGWMLASAELVRGRKVTSFYAIKDDLINAGGVWLDEPVVEDGNLITSRTPADLPLFLPAIIKKLADK